VRAAVLVRCGISCRNSVRLSVCHTRALGQHQTMHCVHFNTAQNGNDSSFLTPTMFSGWWFFKRLPSEICAQSDPPPSKNTDSTDLRL